MTVGLSADVLFDSIDVLTATQINPPPQNCPSPQLQLLGHAPTSAPSSAADAGGGRGTVTVLEAGERGPVRDGAAPLHRLERARQLARENGYDIPAAVQPVIDAYVTEGFDFLAMKLLPNQGVQAMRPVRVTHARRVALPCRFAWRRSARAPHVGITIWVVADGRYEPQNFPFFHIDDSQLVWDWSANSATTRRCGCRTRPS